MALMLRCFLCTSANATTILELNNDCLLEVFKHLDLLSLCTVADVCNRFRQNAKVCFQHSKKRDLNLTNDFKSDGDPMPKFILKSSKILRHFAAYLIRLEFDSIMARHWKKKHKTICRRKILELVIRYCSRTLTELSFLQIVVEDEMVGEMRPLLERLEKLSIRFCIIGQAFLDSLPLWSPELRELELLLFCPWEGPVLRYDVLKSHKKLMKISLNHAHHIQNDDIEEMLKCNPQITKIQLVTCRGINHQIFRSIAYHALNVEILVFRGISLGREDAQYFAEMKNLKSLTFDFTHSPLLNILYAFQQIVAANIPLKNLCLQEMRDSDNIIMSMVIDEILKLKELEELTVKNSQGLTEYHVNKFSKYLPKLRDLRITLYFRSYFTLDKITKWIRNADKLEILYYTMRRDDRTYPTLIVDSDICKQWVEIVEKRCGTANLLLSLNSIRCEARLTPADRSQMENSRLNLQFH